MSKTVFTVCRAYHCISCLSIKISAQLSIFGVGITFQIVITLLSLQTRDATRSLVKNMDRKNVPNQSGGSSSKGGLISSLRQQVHSLERALREKEGQVMDLKNSVKATQIKEMEVQTESYYREICRLVSLSSVWLG